MNEDAELCCTSSPRATFQGSVAEVRGESGPELQAPAHRESHHQCEGRARLWQRDALRAQFARSASRRNQQPSLNAAMARSKPAQSCECNADRDHAGTQRSNAALVTALATPRVASFSQAASKQHLVCSPPVGYREKPISI